MKKKEPVLTPKVQFTTMLELENAILGTSKDVAMPVMDTGHESYTYTTDSYWE